MLEKLFKFQNRLKKANKIEYRRYLYSEIDFTDRMIAVFGARGVGKTTLLFQYLQELEALDKKALYISMDYPFLTGVDLIEVVEEFVEGGGEYILLDEVHRYNDFSAYLKTIYDLFDIYVIFTGSSATSILSAKSDLSRRVTLYSLNGFSFREYLEVKYNSSYSAMNLEALIENHISLSKEILKERASLLDDFKEYLKTGYYPFYFDKQSSYYQSLLNTINLTIDLDLTSLGLIEQKYTYKLKKLLEVVCESKPFEVNYSKIATMAEISRAKLYDYIGFLDDAQMLLLVDEYVKGIKKINKPAKIYLNNTNLLFAYCEKSELGTQRETFFANQVSVTNRLNIAKEGDFLVDTKYLFEIGGENKSFKQIKDLDFSYVVSDDIEVGHGNKIPLWLFGFLY
ncbi:MAG: AAA family ATPase [Campylobacterota bacterium]|nr:AAA family ATPase [Campylobacterota bacterium]